MDTKDKLMGVALILAGIACVVLGLGVASRRNNSNTVNPYVDAYNESGYIEVIE